MEKYVIFLCGVLAFTGAIASSKVDNRLHKVIRVIPETEEQLDFLRQWQSTSSVDFWSFPMAINSFADIRVTPKSYGEVTKALASVHLRHKIMIADLEHLEQQERLSIESRRRVYTGRSIDVENYHTYEEIISYLNDLANTSPLVTTKMGGTSEEGRDIVQVVISSNTTANKPVVFLDCNIHSREWVTTSTCIWIIDQMTTNYGNDTEITSLVDLYDWKFIPIPSPDGYEYSWTTDRTWRKNRAVINGSTCQGVDPNRNFPVGFAGPGSSDLPCNEDYHGGAPFSEKESSAIRDLIAADRGRIRAAISVHAYSQLLMSPYGSAPDLPTDYPEMLRVMEIAVNALTATYGTQYKYGNAHDTLFISSGVSIDHYYKNEGILHSYWIELRDTGLYGYQLPIDQIVPTAIETWNGIKALVTAII